MEYLHGQNPQEQQRLMEQARYLENFVFEGIDFSKCNHILEIGCGVGGQTEMLLKHYPNIKITGIDLSVEQIRKAKMRFAGNTRVNFFVADANNLPEVLHESFDGVFLCWVLEHLADPAKVVQEAYKALKPEGVLYAVEVMNHNFYYLPQHPAIDKFWKAFNDLQVKYKGNPDVGAVLGNLFYDADLQRIHRWTATHFYDKTNEVQRLSMFQYWHDLLKSAAENLVKESYLTTEEVEEFNLAFDALKTNRDSVFYYAVVKACGYKL